MNHNRLVLGTAQFGMNYGVANQRGKVSIDEAKAILQLVRSHGIDRIDTAAAYGESEDTLGAVGMTDMRVITKLRGMPNNCRDVAAWVREEVDTSLQKLRLNKIYGLLIHQAEQLLRPEGERIYSIIRQLKSDGKINRLGVSVYSPAELDILFRHFDFDIIQGPFNLLDQRLKLSGWLEKCQTLGIEVHGRSIFLQGLLLMDRKIRPVSFSRWNHLWDRYEHWLQDAGLKPIEACLLFALAEQNLDGIVVGIDEATQLQQLLEVTSSEKLAEFPDLSCDDPDLINPSRWSNT